MLALEAVTQACHYNQILTKVNLENKKKNQNKMFTRKKVNYIIINVIFSMQLVASLKL
jgi:hypothetical protein